MRRKLIAAALALFLILCAGCGSADSSGTKENESSPASMDGSTDRVIAVWYPVREDDMDGELQAHRDALHQMKQDYELTDEQFLEYELTDPDTLSPDQVPAGCDLIFLPGTELLDNKIALAGALLSAAPDPEEAPQVCICYDPALGVPATNGLTNVHFYAVYLPEGADRELTGEDWLTYYKYAVKCIANDVDIHIEWSLEVEL